MTERGRLIAYLWNELAQSLAIIADVEGKWDSYLWKGLGVAVDQTARRDKLYAREVAKVVESCRFLRQLATDPALRAVFR